MSAANDSRARSSARASNGCLRTCCRDPRVPSPKKLASAVEANVRWIMRQIIETPEGRARLAEGGMKLAGAVCEIATGRVRLLA